MGTTISSLFGADVESEDKLTALEIMKLKEFLKEYGRADSSQEGHFAPSRQIMDYPPAVDADFIVSERLSRYATLRCFYVWVNGISFSRPSMVQAQTLGEPVVRRHDSADTMCAFASSDHAFMSISHYAEGPFRIPAPFVATSYLAVRDIEGLNITELSRGRALPMMRKLNGDFEALELAEYIKDFSLITFRAAFVHHEICQAGGRPIEPGAALGTKISQLSGVLRGASPTHPINFELLVPNRRVGGCHPECSGSNPAH
ncbi:hypothetical protein CONLIGDRAFT_633537 [Coniochaeta ligniaria NRRL 30616]|uniref:Uncharacterized protein n=1 Tax=Coniochaeta ligniaria NRRL 30616 TaxID=1408157 RepID=A0A1J7J1K4_9PEZI|nr:hypothetical protein CONLIGDRAFT_633537 [Coniochaeta ligniaria NRRL 30616]